MNAASAAWWSANQNKFDDAAKAAIQQKIANMPEDKVVMLSSVTLKDPTVFLLIAFFAGGLGVHRFMLGDVGMGVLELLTGGLCGVLWLVDLFTIMGKVKKANFDAIAPYL